MKGKLNLPFWILWQLDQIQGVVFPLEALISARLADRDE